MTNFDTWLSKVTRDHSDRQIAMKAGIAPATFNRQRLASAFTPENAVAIAVAYGASPVRALVALGLLNADHADVLSVEAALREATDEDLVAEVMRRIKDSEEGATVYDAPIPIRPDVAPGQDDLPVSEAPSAATKKVARTRRRKADIEPPAE